VLGDGRGVEAGQVGDPHPFVGGRLKVDVIDPDPELLDEAEAARLDGPPALRRLPGPCSGSWWRGHSWPRQPRHGRSRTGWPTPGRTRREVNSDA
jgi:hypothetical protein